MLFLLYTLHIVICTFLILVILLQQGSGADLSVFGGGGTQTAFGARGATQVIHKLTVWGFVGFIILTFSIALLQGSKSASSVLDGVESEVAEEAPAELTEEAPAEASAEATNDLPAESSEEPVEAPPSEGEDDPAGEPEENPAADS